VSLGLFIGASCLTLTGCGDSASEGDKIEKIDFAKKGEDSMKAYMSQKSASKKK
jgi:hypothetical protein